MKIVVRAIAAAAAGLLAWSVIATTANAGPIAQPAESPGTGEVRPSAANSGATNMRYLYLKWPVKPGAKACQHRVIDLAAGWYQWKKYTAAHDHRIYLAKGRYTWIECVRGYIEPHGKHRHLYATESILMRHGGGTARHPKSWYFQGPSRWMWFGSLLTRV